MSAHTPGPWTFDGNTGVVSGPRATTVGYVAGGNLTAIANGHVLAAAPELLAMLEECIDSLESSHDQALADKVRALVAKAKGQS